MPFDPNRHQRRSIRLPGYDYGQDGAYFVTLCAAGRECLFGTVIGDAMRLSAFGEIVREEWERTAQVRPYVVLDAFVIMPNHMHGIIVIDHPPNTVTTRDATVGATRRVAPTPPAAPDRPKGPAPGSIGAILAQFKSITTKRINELRGTPGAPLWQRSFYEHVVRGEPDLNAIRGYIATNPARWAEDRENPIRAR